MTLAARRRELGACLRAYRNLIEPASVGLPGGGRRRTRGLRREELAALAGVSLTWYTGLEQGRVTPSAQVLDAVGRVLRLDAVGRRHLHRLAAPEPGPASALPREHTTSQAPGRSGPSSALAALRTSEVLRTSAALGALLQTWPASPAALLDHRLDVVATNTSWDRAFGHPADHEPAHRHVLWLLAGAPTPVPDLLPALARQFRMAADLYADEPRTAEIGRLLRADHPVLRPLWDCRGIGAFGHPPLQLDGQPATAHLLHPTGEPGTSVLVAASAP
ncbi:helix-turn-helix domain-containing protein [Frankia sp. R82]|uniref:helix-turn-helix domain-containing protein n=1 Tax=Frankia sp. R82 TaxID=2950553 RepID=UPI002044B671|nr:helix-turn-helix domain-containing protein [Frankia sp. R82]MCM3883192.1 helix-turn-helix domain-containing protein [Frankia sp. R82]